MNPPVKFPFIFRSAFLSGNYLQIFNETLLNGHFGPRSLTRRYYMPKKSKSYIWHLIWWQLLLSGTFFHSCSLECQMKWCDKKKYKLLNHLSINLLIEEDQNESRNISDKKTWKSSGLVVGLFSTCYVRNFTACTTQFSEMAGE